MSFGFCCQIFCSQKSKLYPRSDIPCHSKSPITSVNVCYRDTVMHRSIQLSSRIGELVLINSVIDGDILFLKSGNHEENIVKICPNSIIYGRVLNGSIHFVPDLAKTGH